MKDYEAYVNNGNAEVPEYSKELNIEYFDLRNNNLPGEEMESFENSLACGINSKSSKSFQAQSQGKTLDDVQELANAVTPSSGSIVESAGAVVTGTATVVVGASAAVIAFNATTKVQPKMKVNLLDSGSSFVHYNLELSNLELDKDYDIVIKNNRHEFRLDCVNGENDEYVYNLLPNLQYTLSLVSYNELLGEIEYDSKTFFTLKSEEVLGYSNIEIIYNDDLTCGIKYDTTLVDDKNTLDDTYVVVKVDTGMSGGDGEWEIFNSMYAEDYMREQADMYTYEYDNKIHKGTIREVPSGIIYVELHKMPPNEDEYEGELISRTSKEVVYPLEIEDGSNYIRFSGDYNLIKDLKNIKLKKDNLTIKISLFNDDNVETKIEKDIDISDGLFNLRQLVKQDTTSYSYQVGYYKPDNSFIIIKESDRNTLYGGYYDGYYNQVQPNDENNINIVWKYDDSGNEVFDMTLLTEFENYGNDDAYYRAELLKVDYNWDTEKYEYTLIDSYEGKGNAVFKNVSVGEFNVEDNRYTNVYEYVFRYTSLMNYYDETNGVVKKEIETIEPNQNAGVLSLNPKIMMPMGDFMLLRDGKFALEIYSPEEENISDIRYDNRNISLKLHFFKNNSDQIVQTVDIENARIESVYEMNSYLIIDEELPTGMLGYYAEYEIPYYESYGGNIRTLKTMSKVLMGDISAKITPNYISRRMQGEYSNVSIHLIAYMPNNCHIGLSDGMGSQIAALGYDEDGGYYYYSLSECNEGEQYIFDVFDENNNALTSYAYSLEMEDDLSILSHLDMVDVTLGSFIKDNIIFTYNGDGTININLLADSQVYDDEYNFEVKYKLNKLLEGGSYIGVVYIDDDGTAKIINFNNVDASQTMNYYDSFIVEIGITAESTENIPLYTCEQFMRFRDKQSEYIVGSNLDGYSAFDSRVRCIASHDDETGKYYYELMVPTNAAIDENQEITITGNYNGDDLGSFTKVLKDTEIIVDEYGTTTYRFEVSSSFYECIMVGDASVVMKFNYTLTKDKLERLGNNYSGNLYDNLVISVSQG